ncbi:HAD family hydrolase [Fusibacter bizertensis]
MYKAVIFDLYGTLLDIHTDEKDAHFWRKLTYQFASHGANYTVEEIQQNYDHLVQSALEKARKKGADFPDFKVLKVFKKLYKHKGISPSPRVLYETARIFRLLSLDYVKPYDGAIELLQLIQSHHLRIILLSNAQSSFTMFELKATGLDSYFDAIYLSSDYLLSKPSEQFFHKMLTKENLLSHECLFIGNDHTTDIQGATTVGMDSIYIQTNCSQVEVPEVLPCKWRIDSGNLYEIHDIIKTLYQE